MAEFEELVLSVRVEDDATAKLDQLKRTVSDLGSGSQAAGFERLKRQTSEIDEAIKALTETLTKGPAAWAASDMLAPTRNATPPGARRRPRPDAENFGGEVSF